MIYHLVLGRWIFKNVGIADERFVWEIRGNLGDLYKVEGTSPLLGTLSCNLEKVDFQLLLLDSSMRFHDRQLLVGINLIRRHTRSLEP